jgi:hypothetical protein
MKYFTKSDLKNSYSWKAREEGDNPNITGHPDKDLLDRNEGYEVLYFINKCAKDNNWAANNKAPGHKLERMLRDVPGHLRSHTNIYNWLVSKWNSYN